MSATRTEHDSMGVLQVPADALWGAQTQRAMDNFGSFATPMPMGFVRSLGLLKAAAAEANASLGLLPKRRAQAIAKAGQAIAAGRHDDAFGVDVYQTGSGTSSNMNANEVIATLASRSLNQPVHPNDDVNLGQSSNDVIPSTIRIATVLAVHKDLLPGIVRLRRAIAGRKRAFGKQVKTGRTHLMDAMPLTVGQELDTWDAQLRSAYARLADTLKRVRRLPIGGTAVGTGINSHPDFGKTVVELLNDWTDQRYTAASNTFEGIAAQDDVVELSGQLNALAVALMKIGNDLRWMNSGPLAGLAEIQLPALQPGSSIMPGKVNPVVPEATNMACAQVMGYHTAISIAGQSGNFQLNVMLPLIAHNLLDAIHLLATSCFFLADSAIAGMQLNRERIGEALSRNPILVTAMNPVIGYEKAAAIAKRAYAEHKPVLEVALEDSGLDEATLRRLLDPAALTSGGLGSE